MKLRPLPGIDLANIAPLPVDEKRRKLRSFRAPIGNLWSYHPARAQLFNVFNPENPLGIVAQAPTLNQIIRTIERDCKSDKQRESCVEVTKLLHDWVQQNVGRAIDKRVPSMSMGPVGSLRYWENFAAVQNSCPVFPFFDHRRSNGLSKIARRFVFSMMHEQIRMADPDFENARLLIMKFPQQKKSSRSISVYYDEGVELFDLYDLQEMVEETYRLWAEVSEEVASETPRRAAGGFWD